MIYKLGDLGLLQDYSTESSYTLPSGTRRFMAPEVMDSEHGELTYENTKLSDIYSMGLVVFLASQPNHNNLLNHKELLNFKLLKKRLSSFRRIETQ